MPVSSMTFPRTGMRAFHRRAKPPSTGNTSSAVHTQSGKVARSFLKYPSRAGFRGCHRASPGHGRTHPRRRPRPVLQACFPSRGAAIGRTGSGQRACPWDSTPFVRENHWADDTQMIQMIDKDRRLGSLPQAFVSRGRSPGPVGGTGRPRALRAARTTIAVQSLRSRCRPAGAPTSRPARRVRPWRRARSRETRSERAPAG